MFGFLNIYKPEGITSFDVIAYLRKVTHIKQIGHTGTLDPFAVGVLPVCIGKSTKLIEFLPDDKAYLAVVQFGMETDTCDKDGQIINTFNRHVTKSELENVLPNFSGEIEQIPPIYSAIKVNGKKLYEYARAGEQIEIKPRKVVINKILLKSFDEDAQRAQIYIECSKGTYVRSIARDIGKLLANGAYLTALERVKAGEFTLSNCVKLTNIKTVEDVKNNLINPSDVLSQSKYYLNDVEKERVVHGMSIKINKKSLYLKDSDGENSLVECLLNKVVFFIYSGKMYGVGIINGEEIKVKKVFEVL